MIRTPPPLNVSLRATFSPEISYAEALRVGDAQNGVMERIMALPNIEDEWDGEHVMARLYELAMEKLDDLQAV